MFHRGVIGNKIKIHPFSFFLSTETIVRAPDYTGHNKFCLHNNLHFELLVQSVQHKQHDELIFIQCMHWNVFKSVLGCTICLMVTLCLLDVLLFAAGSLCETEMISFFIVRYKDEKARKRTWYYHSWWFEIKNYMGTPAYVAEGCFPIVFQWDLFFERFPHAGHPHLLHFHPSWFPPLQASSCSEWKQVTVTEDFP